jgi:hypothetical protein
VQTASEQGFTVIEAIVALAIITSGVVSLAGLARQVTDTVARSRRHLAAATFADAFVAIRAGTPLAATAPDCLSRDTGGCFDTLDGEGRVTAGPASFVRRWRIAPRGGAGLAWADGLWCRPPARRVAPRRAPCLAHRHGTAP